MAGREGVRQDMPRKGGFPAVEYKRKFAKPWASGYVLFGVALGISTFGLYKVFQSNRKRRALKEEITHARIAIIPMLQAETDRSYVIAKQRLIAEEAELMKDVKGWVPGASVYNTTRFVPPYRTPEVGEWARKHI